jgi:hypothetical protein
VSIDVTTVCHSCKQYHHLGQWMGGRWSFGYGSNDVQGRLNCGEFIEQHLTDQGHRLELMLTDSIPAGYTDEDGE